MGTRKDFAVLLSPNEAAEVLGVHRAWILRRVKDGTLAHVRLSERVIRIDSATIDELIAKGQRSAKRRVRRRAT